MGRFNWDWTGEGSPDEAYSRVTEPERLRPLHDWTLENVERLCTEYDVTLEKGEGIDTELERYSPARPTIKLTTRHDSCAPITIAFTEFPRLAVRVGRWVTDYFPSCGRDACDEIPEEEFERPTELSSDVVARQLRESMRLQTEGDGWSSRQFWSDDERRNSGGSRVPRAKAAQVLGGKNEIALASGSLGNQNRMLQQPVRLGVPVHLLSSRRHRGWRWSANGVRALRQARYSAYVKTCYYCNVVQLTKRKHYSHQSINEFLSVECQM